MLLGVVFAVGGLAVLTVAADEFVKGAARLAVVFKVAPIVVGAVIIGFGTSAPEMVVSGLAAADGNLDIGVGNVVGSNVANISLVLAAATLITPVPVKSGVLRREAPLSVAAVLVFAGLLQGDVNRWEGALLSVLLAGVLIYILRTARETDALTEDVDEMLGHEQLRTRVEAVRTTVGLVMVAGSAWFIVEGSERIAEEFELTGGFVGFTLVAVGTSAPELVTAIAAARQGETDLLIGNLLGSNLFNSLAVGGLIALIGPGPVLDTRLADWGSLMMVSIVIISWLMMITGAGVSRREGLVLGLMWVVAVVVLAGGEDVETALHAVRP